MSGKRPYVVYPDDYPGYDVNFFCIPKHYEGALECVLIPGGLVQDRVEKLARDIVEDLDNESLAAMCVLKGGYKFFTDLLDRVKQYNGYAGDNSIPISVDFIHAKSYEDDHSTGKVRVAGIEDLTALKNKNVLLVEDVIDTGRTIKTLVELFKTFHPKTVKVASLVVKRTKENQYRPDYCGFEVPDKFVVGYAIDYNEYFRDLNHVCVVNEHGKIKFGSSYGKKGKLPENKELL